MRANHRLAFDSRDCVVSYCETTTGAVSARTMALAPLQPRPVHSTPAAGLPAQAGRTQEQSTVHEWHSTLSLSLSLSLPPPAKGGGGRGRAAAFVYRTLLLCTWLGPAVRQQACSQHRTRLEQRQCHGPKR